jgi:mRNA interferase MazF
MLNEIKNSFNRGSIILCDLGKRDGSIQYGIRPCAVISNDLNNKFSTVLTVVPLSTSKFKKSLPTHVKITTANSKIEKDSIALCEQPMLVTKDSIIKELFELDNTLMEQISRGVMIQLGLTQFAMNSIAV